MEQHYHYDDDAEHKHKGITATTKKFRLVPCSEIIQKMIRAEAES